MITVTFFWVGIALSAVWTFYRVVLYPYCVSPLRTLPQAEVGTPTQVSQGDWLIECSVATGYGIMPFLSSSNPLANCTQSSCCIHPMMV
jgi:hypothetical protein